MLVTHLACEVGKAEIGGDERGLVVDGRCAPLVGLLHGSVGQLDERAHAIGQGQTGGPESGDEREALGYGSVRVHGSPGAWVRVA
ncbi:hypothetical protein STRTUCAR8_04707, partial [Streptomyces turgidiscabies Car8]